MLKAGQLRDMASEELGALLSSSKQDLYSFQTQLKQTKKLEKPHMLRELKKNIALILTILNERQKMGSQLNSRTV